MEWGVARSLPSPRGPSRLPTETEVLPTVPGRGQLRPLLRAGWWEQHTEEERGSLALPDLPLHLMPTITTVPALTRVQGQGGSPAGGCPQRRQPKAHLRIS